MNPVYRAGWLFFNLIYRFYFGWRIYNPERVPATGSVILAANHASFLDPPLVGSPLKREASFLARDTLFLNPIARWVLIRWRAIPVDREGSSASGLKRVLEALKHDRAVVLFPEGTRTRNGELQRARSGVGMIALKSGAPVVPVRVWGSYEAWGRHVKWPKPKRLTLKYGHPLDFTALRDEAKVCSKERLKAIYEEIANEIMASIARLEPKPD